MSHPTLQTDIPSHRGPCGEPGRRLPAALPTGGQRGRGFRPQTSGVRLTLQQLGMAPVLPAVLLTRAGSRAPLTAPDATKSPCRRDQGG